MPRHDLAVDFGIERMRADALVAEALVQPDCGALGVAYVEVEHGDPEFEGEPLDLEQDVAADAAAARPGRDERTGHRAGESLRLVVARRARQQRRAGDNAVKTADD